MIFFKCTCTIPSAHLFSHLLPFRYIPNVCVNTTKQSTVYVSLLSSASPSLTGPTQDAAGILAVTVIATETLEALQQV
jgi:hypothetical protein